MSFICSVTRARTPSIAHAVCALCPKRRNDNFIDRAYFSGENFDKVSVTPEIAGAAKVCRTPTFSFIPRGSTLGRMRYNNTSPSLDLFSGRKRRDRRKFGVDTTRHFTSYPQKQFLTNSPLCAFSTTRPSPSHKQSWKSLVLTEPLPSDLCSRSIATVGYTMVLRSDAREKSGGVHLWWWVSRRMPSRSDGYVSAACACTFGHICDEKRRGTTSVLVPRLLLPLRVESHGFQVLSCNPCWSCSANLPAFSCSTCG